MKRYFQPPFLSRAFKSPLCFKYRACSLGSEVRNLVSPWVCLVAENQTYGQLSGSAFFIYLSVSLNLLGQLLVT